MKTKQNKTAELTKSLTAARVERDALLAGLRELRAFAVANNLGGVVVRVAAVMDRAFEAAVDAVEPPFSE